MKKSDVTNMYTIEELIPIVKKLTEQITSKESSSVSYERARQFMEAVIYCITHCSTGNNLISQNKLSAADAYQLGYNTVIEKARRTQEKI